MGTGRGRRGVAFGAAVVLVAAVAVLGRGAVLGETLASGPGWELKVRSSPFYSSITWDEPRRSGGAGGLARPGSLSETVLYTPPDATATYVAGLLPANAASVWVLAGDGQWREAEIRHVLGARVYIATIEAEPDGVVLETRDDGGQPLERHEGPPPPPGAAADAI